MTGPTRGRWGSHHQIISIIIIQRGGILLQPRGERRGKKSDEFAKYMEHRKPSLPDSGIFTENDDLDPALAIALPRVRWAVFGSVLFQRGGGRDGDVALRRPPDLKHSSRIRDFIIKGEVNMWGGKKRGERGRSLSFTYLFIGCICFVLEWKS